MKKLIFAIVIAGCVQAYADCGTVKEAMLALAVYGSNWENANTTRTPEGGPYRYHQFVCTGSKCDIKISLITKRVYSPGHADADAQGYVLFPDINRDHELATLSAYADALRMAAHSCGSVTLTDNYDSASVEYRDKMSPVTIDIFNFGRDRKLVSWMRENQSGRSFTLNF